MGGDREREDIAISQQLLLAGQKMARICNLQIPELISQTDVCYATNPLDYAASAHEQYLQKWGGLGAQTILLGMNPGPWGMGQTGVPFGATGVVQEILGITNAEIIHPSGAHPKRPVSGLSLERQEVSGTRLWNLLLQHYGTSERIFENVFVLNHCPLLLLGESGKNLTPDKLTGEATRKILSTCDEHLLKVVEILKIKKIIGVGKYAEKRAKIAIPNHKKLGIEIDTVWHPSPASPLANKNDGMDWRANVSAKLP
ncbi:MAG: single-stranded DNA-binding protein [Euryarchaeota archaeon]|jgi:single-strand selective monofunctional uracil DNA glycosylase|nr:single-stranded DNA-binding protein [Euryarchaeota archaeon]MBT3971157.1 single-stranded DNA-binding protein [Euryarchaeota archaeon]MBT4407470.1 single-stranded DNA-binding protein [Euryarchaeota archaeon]MBT6645871.1 single-stranded DNA-binding protein [Euryarchaeota archaeon]